VTFINRSNEMIALIVTLKFLKVWLSAESCLNRDWWLPTKKYIVDKKQNDNYGVKGFTDLQVSDPNFRKQSGHFNEVRRIIFDILLEIFNDFHYIKQFIASQEDSTNLIKDQKVFCRYLELTAVDFNIHPLVIWWIVELFEDGLKRNNARIFTAAMKPLQLLIGRKHILLSRICPWAHIQPFC
jgi:hypothetical protein